MSAGKRSLFVSGIRRLDRKLRQLEPRLQRKLIGQAMRAGLKVLASAVKSVAPVWHGVLRGAIKVRAIRKRKRGTVRLNVEILATDRTKRTSARTDTTVFYPAIVEYGSKKRSLEPNDFMKRAFDSHGHQVKSLTLEHLRAGIEREAKKP